MKKLFMLIPLLLIASCGNVETSDWTIIDTVDSDVIFFKLYTMEKDEIEGVDYVAYNSDWLHIAMDGGDDTDIYFPLDNIEYWGIDR